MLNRPLRAPRLVRLLRQFRPRQDSGELTLYDTQFPSTENPINEVGFWRNGGTDALDWKDCQSVAGSPGYIHGTAASPGYDDCVAVGRGFHPQAHWVEGTVRRTTPYTPPDTQEIQLALGITLGPNFLSLYEFLFSFGGGMQIVRWNGSLGNITFNGDPTWTNTPVGSGYSNVVDGDVLYAEFDSRSGSPILTCKVNGSTVYTVTDTNAAKLTTGQPGVMFFARAGTGLDMTKYCFKRVRMGSLAAA